MKRIFKKIGKKTNRNCSQPPPRGGCRRMLAVLLGTLRQLYGCTEGSRFEDCEEFIQCLSYPPNCTELVIDTNGKVGAHGWLPSVNIVGTIPSAIGNLTALTTLTIEENGVSGTIPETIGLLKNLTYLRLASAPKLGASARLSGTLPPSLGNLVRLEHLLVDQTQISGTLPLSLGGLTALQYVSVIANSFTGVIPEIFFELTALIGLDLQHNELSGTLSESIGELSQLKSLTLYGNNLSGTLSETIGKLAALKSLQLQNNRFSGTVPDTFAALTSLRLLFLESNSFTAVGSGICAIQDHLIHACDLSNNEIPGDNPNWPDPGTNCPGCLNSKTANCNVAGSQQPIFPNKVCPDPSSCTCYAPSPTLAPSPAPTFTSAPTKMTQGNHWEKFMAAMCFGHDEHEAPGCFGVTFALLIGAVGAGVFGVFYECVLIPCVARRDSKRRGTPYKEALRHAFTHQCWCCTRCGCEEHAHRERGSSSILSWATAESTGTAELLEAPLSRPFFLDGVITGRERDAYEQPSERCITTTANVVTISKYVHGGTSSTLGLQS